MTLRLDLHCHSTASDGRYPADQVLARALASGLDVLALTDHDLAPVLPHGTLARPDDAKGRPPAALRLLHGVEVTGAPVRAANLRRAALPRGPALITPPPE